MQCGQCPGTKTGDPPALAGNMITTPRAKDELPISRRAKRSAPCYSGGLAAKPLPFVRRHFADRAIDRLVMLAFR